MLSVGDYITYIDKFFAEGKKVVVVVRYHS